ncbi:hypothetical protein H6G41_18050 [Tolypothrix sp. FACHB-123]|uniref:hypothetical protein n=1 Tax=Tolypothrix sp. FACHB-123 TaxID=2692868 RepID=UPI001684D9E9|nr:hypothetical protein [Tolypothrix sp. FACHB-123]MBD2356505.1 hypothetical protein [Tolypothrix sp. FACHB-123]
MGQQSTVNSQQSTVNSAALKLTRSVNRQPSHLQNLTIQNNILCLYNYWEINLLKDSHGEVPGNAGAADAEARY